MTESPTRSPSLNVIIIISNHSRIHSIYLSQLFLSDGRLDDNGVASLPFIAFNASSVTLLHSFMSDSCRILCQFRVYRLSFVNTIFHCKIAGQSVAWQCCQSPKVSQYPRSTLTPFQTSQSHRGNRDKIEGGNATSAITVTWPIAAPEPSSPTTEMSKRSGDRLRDPAS